MRIDGKEIAAEIFTDLTRRVGELQKKNIVPHLVVVLVGNDPASESYVRQKDLKAKLIGAKASIVHLPSDISEKELLSTIEQFNNNNNVHGLIVQRPLPSHIKSHMVNQATDVNKDIDAFHKNSPFTMPLAAAVLKILEHVQESIKSDKSTKSIKGETASPFDTSEPFDTFPLWLKSKNIVVVGKGETGGGPTIELLKKLGAHPHVIDSKTENAPLITEEADIIITTVGRDNVIRSENLKKGVVLIGVGMHKGDDGKLHGDYEEDDIKNTASFYTPIPGGVGPVNVAMLLKNLLDAVVLCTQN